MLSAIEDNLTVGIRLLTTISDQQYSDNSVVPYHSSIGGHIRHILDIFDCIFDGLKSGHIDLTARKRNLLVERSTAHGLQYIEKTLTQLRTLASADFDQIIDVSDDLGQGMVTSKYTLGAVLIQAHSHAIHHYASVGYIVTNLGIDMPHEDFGFNPTTPRHVA